MSIFQKIPKSFYIYLLMFAAVLAIISLFGLNVNINKVPIEDPAVISKDREPMASEEASQSGTTSSSIPSPKGTLKSPSAKPSSKPSTQPSPTPSFRPCTKADWDSCPKPRNASEVDAYRACIKPKCDSTYSYQESNATEVQELPPDLKEVFEKEMQTGE